MARTRHALMAGGGTGGHVFPALAVAEVLLDRGWQVSFCGSDRGLEARLVGERDLPFHALDARPIVGQGVSGKVRSLFTLARSAWQGRALVRKLGVDAVIGTGGYVSAGAVLGGRLARRPTLLIEPNATPGLANRQLSRWATEAALAFDEASAGLSCPMTVTGVPVRGEFFEVGELPDGPPRLLVLGGSQGALSVNRALPAAIAYLAAEPSLAGLQVLHQAGAKHVDETEAAYRAVGIEPGRLPSPAAEAGFGSPVGGAFGSASTVEVVAFLDDVATAMAESHLVISRAGALTVAELCAAGRGSVLVPLVLAEAHQRANAAALEEAGAAKIVEQAAVEGAGDEFAARLASNLHDLLSDRDRLQAMSSAARSLARPRASGAIADRIEALVDGRAA